MADKEKYWDFKSRMRLTVCFKAGRFTLTQTSWTSPELRSRKWMSGYAAALAAKSDRRLFENRICAILALRESFRLSAGESPFPLDNYLSWMSPVSLFTVPHFTFGSLFGWHTSGSRPAFRSSLHQSLRFFRSSDSFLVAVRLCIFFAGWYSFVGSTGIREIGKLSGGTSLARDPVADTSGICV